jgi:hypothetical protein
MERPTSWLARSIVVLAACGAGFACDGGGAATDDGGTAGDDGAGVEAEVGGDADATPDAEPEVEVDVAAEEVEHGDGGDADGPPDGPDAGDSDAPVDEPGEGEGDGADEADATPTGLMTLVWLEDAAARGLVCNDGTPAGYYVRRGSGEGSSRWLIHLEGGGFCYDVASCDQRQLDLPQFMTSGGWAATKSGDGAQSSSALWNPDFHDANHVYLPYCSSDVWSGDREASPATGGRHFRGGRILRAVIDALTDPATTPSPNLADAGEVLFSGTSAGGIGVQANVDWLVGRLPGATVRGLNDAGWFPDVDPYDPGIVPLRDQLGLGYAWWSATVDASCAAAHPGAEGRCYVGPDVHAEIAAPFFVQASQGDLIVLGFLGAVFPFDAGESAYAAAYATALRESLAPVAAAFSSDTWIHGLLMGVTFWLTAVDGVSFRDTVGNWFFGRAGPIKVILE